MILIIDTNEKENSLHYFEFVKPVQDLIKKQSKVIHFTKVTKKDLNKAEKIIICGTSLINKEYLKKYKKFLWIKSINKPILGICAGMQIIGKIFNSRLKKSKEIGPVIVTQVKKDRLFENIKEVYTLHSIGITTPKEFQVLLKNKKNVQAIKHKKKEMYGVLFHPEVLNKEIIIKFAE